VKQQFGAGRVVFAKCLVVQPGEVREQADDRPIWWQARRKP
jgi:hypothetical protein